jgi:hypothetical protein
MAAYRYPRRYRYGSRMTSREKAALAVVALVLAGAGQGAVSTVRHAGHAAGVAAAAVAPGQVSTGSNVALGQQLAASYGWTGGQWDCLDWLWTRESGWRIVWNYQGSGAYGIPQSLPADKMASAGLDWQTNPATEIRWGLGYIKGTYGTPCNAWAHELADGWY